MEKQNKKYLLLALGWLLAAAVTFAIALGYQMMGNTPVAILHTIISLIELVVAGGFVVQTQINLNRRIGG